MLIGGTVPVPCAEDPSRVFNTSMAFDAAGALLARYDKVHLFAFGEEYNEAKTVAFGRDIVSVTSSIGPILLSVCYDVRFPELYRAVPEPPTLISVPAAFTCETGAAHWELLLRCRAIENQCYVIGAAQAGVHPSGRRSYGHSMIVDPWGRVLARLSGTDAGVCTADVDLSLMGAVRARLPALRDRRIDLASIAIKPPNEERVSHLVRWS